MILNKPSLPAQDELCARVARREFNVSNDAGTCHRGHAAGIRHRDFGITSSFGLRHSSFPRSLLVFDEPRVHIRAGEWRGPGKGPAPVIAASCASQYERAVLISSVHVNERGVGLLFMDCLGQVAFAVRRDVADNYIGPVRQLARRIKGGAINHLDVSPRLGLPILLLTVVGGKIVPRPAAADHKQQKSRYHPFHTIFHYGVPAPILQEKHGSGRPPFHTVLLPPPGPIVKGWPWGECFLNLNPNPNLLLPMKDEEIKIKIKIRIKIRNG